MVCASEGQQERANRVHLRTLFKKNVPRYELGLERKVTSMSDVKYSFRRGVFIVAHLWHNERVALRLGQKIAAARE